MLPTDGPNHWFGNVIGNIGDRFGNIVGNMTWQHHSPVKNELGYGWHEPRGAHLPVHSVPLLGCLRLSALQARPLEAVSSLQGRREPDQVVVCLEPHGSAWHW